MENLHARDLRIGNLIRWKSTNDIEAVVDIKSSGKYQTINNIQITDAEPIPLNEEWLLKMGFVKHIKLYGYIGYVYNGYFIRNFQEIIILGSSVILAKIKYVHQLQNLYFALTGEELTINEK
jgi:hypothetical protein